MFLKEVSKSNVGKLDSCTKIKEGKGRLALGGVQVRRIWKYYFEDLYNVDNQEQVAVHMSCFEDVWIEKHFGRELRLR